jgi:archaellum component FlaG (FlaF/FlaG flagellin family)
MLRKYESQIVLAIFAFWVIGFAFQAGRSTQHQEDRKQIEAAHKSSYAIQDQKRANETNSRPNAPTDPQTENRGGETPEVTFVWLKLGEGLLVFVTIWLVLVTRALVDGARDTGERQLRAYVGPESIGFQDSIGPYKIQIIIVVKNFGATPAYHFRTDIRVSIRENPLAAAFVSHAKVYQGAGVTLMPGSTSVIVCEPAAHDQARAVQVLNEAVGGARAIYVDGEIKYTDAFRNDRFTNVRKIGCGHRIIERGGSPFIDANDGNDSD